MATVGAVSNKEQSNLAQVMKGQKKDQAGQMQKKQAKRIEKRQTEAVQKLTAAAEQPKGAEEVRDKAQAAKTSESKMTAKGARLDKVA